jgi:hypothetical protein
MAHGMLLLLILMDRNVSICDVRRALYSGYRQRSTTVISGNGKSATAIIQPLQRAFPHSSLFQVHSMYYDFRSYLAFILLLLLRLPIRLLQSLIHVVAREYRFILGGLALLNARLQRLNDSVVIGPEEDRNRIALLASDVDHAMNGRDEDVVGPALKHIADIDDECAWNVLVTYSVDLLAESYLEWVVP